MYNEPKIIIIGAGAAGIAAASRLLQNGLNNLTILEAKNRIGGRTHTVEFSDNVVDLGAQWVHGERGNVVYDLASPYNLLESSKNLNDLSQHIFLTTKGEVVPKKEGIEALKIYQSISDSTYIGSAEGSFGEYFTNVFYKTLKENRFTDNDRAEQFLNWMHQFHNSIDCTDTWFDISVKGQEEYWECEGDSLLNWKYQGYKTLFDLLMQKCPDPKSVLPIMEKIELNKDVVNINYTSNNNVIVKTKDGAKYIATHVIFTGSLGVLKTRHLTMFTPPLPEKKQRAIMGLSIGTVNKIFLEFPHRWWQECGAFNLLWSKENKAEFLKSHGQENEWLCNIFSLFTVDYQPRVLCAWITGEHARRMESLSDAEVSDGLYLLLETFLGKAYNIAKPERILRSQWYTDEHFRGSYSFLSITAEQLDIRAKDLAEPIITDNAKPQILFAGEATHDHYHSTVHGAVETGFREADRIIHFQRTRGWLKNVTLRSSGEITRRTKVVIVGGGIAGLAAAKTLQDERFQDYLLIEAQNEIGGRIKSIPWKKNWIEFGAQFLHGDQSELAKLCYQNELLSDIQCRDGQGMFLRDDGTKVKVALVNEVDDVVRTALEDCEEYGNRKVEMGYENIGRALRTRFRKHLDWKNDSKSVRNVKEEIFDWNVRFLTIDNSCITLDELSTKHWGKFKYVGGPEHLSLKAGYSSLTKLLARSLNKENVRLNTAVELIEWQEHAQLNGTPIVLTLSDGSKVRSDCVIVTCSLGYLKEHHRTMFLPSLPARLVKGIESLGFGLINKIFLDFGAPWWDADTNGFQFLWQKNCENKYKLARWTRDITGFDVLPNQQGVLLGWVGGRGAWTIETLTEQQVTLDIETLFRHYLKFANMPSIKRCLRTRWNANKYTRGSYSHIPSRCDSNGVTPDSLAQPVWTTINENDSASKDVPVVMFAGEATHSSLYSTTHGAYETGVKQAQTFLRHHTETIKT